MNHRRLSGSFSVFRLLLPAVMLVVLAGCSSSVSRVETWQGNAAQAVNAATLKAPGEIRVTAVNGRSVGNFLMDDLALDYALLPGQNDVVFIYKTIWAKTTVVDNGESKVDIVESKPQLASFDAKAGTVYEFRFDEPTTRREAEREMKDFSAEIVSSAGQVATVSTNYVPSQALARTPIPGIAGVQATSAAAQGNALDTLKAVWANASDEEKKNFLRWAFE
ncbi:hypothetical protein ABA45_03740 [Marinobacter psychrophilus]|jgi:uncharacterized protein YccT (UPF0319 family)|uniref:DUF2057 domain-containing protein n=1 Tax=Marinobacter psychrophilus TaxID=330734 RepID=A0A0H4I1G3_9GAMM|nr:DUF2057 family protein [Marinobacter psychrophilus]AKO51648.1 hypothetical protein ABA45_03740 [Marinobacter psychrophilus]